MVADKGIGRVARAHQPGRPPDRMDFRRVAGRFDRTFMDIALDIETGTYGVDQFECRFIDGAGDRRPFAAFAVHHHPDIVGPIGISPCQALAETAADAEALCDDGFERMHHCAGFAGCGAACW